MTSQKFGAAGLSPKLQQRGQSGFMLIAVLALVGLVAIIGTALVAMTITATRVSAQSTRETARVMQSDAALESIVSTLRRNPSAAQTDCYDSATLGSHPKSYMYPSGASVGEEGSVIVSCETTGTFSAVRDITLRAYTGSPEKLAGVARVQITDMIGSEVRPGINLVVCDWQLGSAVRTSAAPCA